MKDRKSILLIIVSFLLFVVSFTLLWSWGYRFYIKSPGTEAKAGVVASPSAVHTTRDSLQTIYTATVNELDEHISKVSSNTDSIKGELDKKLGEFYRLRSEIAALLKDNSTDAGLDVARGKISTLQAKVKELLDKNADVESENKKLAALIQQLSGIKTISASGAQRSIPENNVAEKNNSVLTVSDLSLSAITTENDREQETTQAQKAEKLVGSFVLKNNVDQGNVSEVMVIVLQPDGQVVKNSAWESGTFITSEGKKVYSYKIRFDNNREPKRMLFSLTADKYLRGSYTMQVFYNGAVIGKLVKTLI
jgi:hypothetical protein